MLLWSTLAVGLLLGLAHARYVYGIVACDASGSPRSRRASPAYYAVWTLLLWGIFGAYVLATWLIGLIPYLVFRALR